MKNFIEELYYGNLEPHARNTKVNESNQKELKILSDNETLLTERLSNEDKALFLAYANAWSVVNGESTLDSFITGFRLGARFAFDTFASEQAPFDDLLKGN